MQSYTFHSGQHLHSLTEHGDNVTSCTIEFLEGLPFKDVREMLERKGYKLIPVIEAENEFTFKGETFYILYRDNRIIRITKDDEEITWNELPEQLKGLL